MDFPRNPFLYLLYFIKHSKVIGFGTFCTVLHYVSLLRMPVVPHQISVTQRNVIARYRLEYTHTRPQNIITNIPSFLPSSFHCEYAPHSEKIMVSVYCNATETECIESRSSPSQIREHHFA
jgi:hypothetical protein